MSEVGESDEEDTDNNLLNGVFIEDDDDEIMSDMD